MSNRQTGNRGSSGNPRDVQIVTKEMNPILYLMLMAIYAFLTVMTFIWLSGWYTVANDSTDGAFKAVTLLLGPLGMLLLTMFKRS